MHPDGRKKERQHITASRLRQQHGWTEDLIRQFLGTPDLQPPKPHQADGPLLGSRLAKLLSNGKHPNPMPDYAAAKTTPCCVPTTKNTGKIPPPRKPPQPQRECLHC